MRSIPTLCAGAALIAGILTLGNVSWILGPLLRPPLILGGIAGLICFKAVAYPPTTRFQKHQFGFASIAVAGIADLLVCAKSAGAFAIPAGAHVRPMDLEVVVISFWTAAIVFLTSYLAIKLERPGTLGVIAMVLGFTPLCVYFALWGLASRIAGFEFSP